MHKIRLTADCPDCDEEMKFFVGDLTGSTEPTIDISNFEQTTFHCENCDKDFHTGDIDLYSDDEL